MEAGLRAKLSYKQLANMKNKYLIIVLLAIIAVTFGAVKVHANPSNLMALLTTGTGADATSTSAWINAGIATTTVSYDTYQYDTQGRTPDSALLLINFTSTSTTGVKRLNIRREFSNNNIDWYPESLIVSSTATTSILSGSADEYQMSLASTSAAIPGTDTYSTATSTYFRTVAMPFFPIRYQRFVIYVPVGGTGGNLWAAFQPRKQQSSTQ